MELVSTENKNLYTFVIQKLPTDNFTKSKLTCGEIIL